jgi:hypothetical protein
MILWQGHVDLERLNLKALLSKLPRCFFSRLFFTRAHNDVDASFTELTRCFKSEAAVRTAHKRNLLRILCHKCS